MNKRLMRLNQVKKRPLDGNMAHHRREGETYHMYLISKVDIYTRDHDM